MEFFSDEKLGKSRLVVCKTRFYLFKIVSKKDTFKAGFFDLAKKSQGIKKAKKTQANNIQTRALNSKFWRIW